MELQQAAEKFIEAFKDFVEKLKAEIKRIFNEIWDWVAEHIDVLENDAKRFDPIPVKMPRLDVKPLKSQVMNNKPMIPRIRNNC